jgi:hypothetical protein
MSADCDSGDESADSLGDVASDNEFTPNDLPAHTTSTSHFDPPLISPYALPVTIHVTSSVSVTEVKLTEGANLEDGFNSAIVEATPKNIYFKVGDVVVLELEGDSLKLVPTAREESACVVGSLHKILGTKRILRKLIISAMTSSDPTKETKKYTDAIMSVIHPKTDMRLFMSTNLYGRIVESLKEKKARRSKGKSAAISELAAPAAAPVAAPAPVVTPSKKHQPDVLEAENPKKCRTVRVTIEVVSETLSDCFSQLKPLGV